jgi:SAM-dependent methyltransferase
MDWRDFWDGTHSIYVNARHKRLHYQAILEDLQPYLAPQMRVLDYGCGDALCAEALARRCERLYLFDAAPNVRARLRQAFGDQPRIVIVDPDELADLADSSLDLIVVNSLLQYISREEFDALLVFCRRRLVPAGQLLIADVVTPNSDLRADTAALLRFAIEGGFFLAALGGLARTFFSPYRRLRGSIGFTTYDAQDILMRLNVHGYDAQRAPTNIGHNHRRMTFLAKRRPQLPSLS